MKLNIANLAIVLTIGVILVGSLMMPVISDATKEVRSTYTNGTASSPHYDSGAIAFSIELASGPVLTINGETEDTTAFADYTILAATDTLVVFWRSTGALHVWESGGVAHTYGAGSYDFEDGTITQTIGSTTSTFAYNALYTYSTNGEYVYVPYTAAPYVSSQLDDFYALGYKSGTSLSVYNNGTVYVNGVVSTTTTITADTNPTNNSEVSSLQALAIGTVGGQNLIVKESYTISMPNANGIISMLSILPILVIIALVMLPISVIYARRND